MSSGFWIVTAAFGAILLAAWAAGSSGLVLGNATTSVPRGLYLRAQPDRATYVTFCLGERHRGAVFYSQFCSPENPDAIAILKRIRLHQGPNELLVEGDTEQALDSRYLGPISIQEITGWWTPLLQLGGSRLDR